jgi:hypothetical protein
MMKSPLGQGVAVPFKMWQVASLFFFYFYVLRAVNFEIALLAFFAEKSETNFETILDLDKTPH